MNKQKHLNYNSKISLQLEKQLPETTYTKAKTEPIMYQYESKFSKSSLV
jgi:hypothetical protein